MAQASTPAQVARAATQSATDFGGALTLLGTFGASDNPSAILRLRNGRTTSVSRGDSVAGQTVVAIEEGRVALSRNGTAHWLDMPKPSS